MTNRIARPFLSGFAVLLSTFMFGQNVGIHTLTPLGKLHIKGSEDVPQLIIDADTIQGNTNPLIKLRKSDGTELLWIHSDDSTNVFIGLKAGKSNVVSPQGINNTFIGSRAGSSNTNGRDNTAIGTNALFSNTKSSLNTAIGTNALYTQSFSPGGAWYQSYNVAIGYEALYSNQPNSGSSGANNTAVGTSALRSNTTASQNTAIGSFALYLNTTGAHNTAQGYQALNSNTTASENTAVGSRAMLIQSYNAGGVPWVSANVAVGYEALYSNQPTTSTEGIHNTAIGHTSLRANTIGQDNTSVGYDALHLNTTGYANTASGSFALWNNTTGNHNTGTGQQSLYATNTGNYNTGYGYNSCSYNTTGSYNTSIGVSSYFTLLNGQNTTSVGFSAGSNVNADNRIEIGNTSNTWIGGQMGWSTFSDSRIKEQIEEDVPGLAFIQRLRPVTYHLNIHRQNEMMYAGKKDTGEWDSKYDIEKIKITGFLAQDVEAAAREIGYDFSGVQRPAYPDELYSLRYSDFVMPLVVASQELAAKNDTQDEMIDKLKTENEMLLQRIEKLERLLENR